MIFFLFKLKPGICTITGKNPPYDPPYITYGYLSHYELPTVVARIKRVLANNGLVAVAMRVTKWTFPFYRYIWSINLKIYTCIWEYSGHLFGFKIRSGVFADEPCKAELHHAVVIVGYNDNQDKKEKYPYWVITS